MTTPGSSRSRVTERLRARIERLMRRHDDVRVRSVIRTASFEHSHRVWIPDPPRGGHEKWRG